jgi:hypothetical protein
MAFAVMAIGMPVAVLSAGLGQSFPMAAVLGLSVAIAPFLILPVVLRILIGPDHIRRARQLATAGAIAYAISFFFSPGVWAVLDLAFSAALLVLAIRPQLINSLPERAKFDWAGARGEGFTAPRGASFEYAFKPAAVAMLSVPFVVRGGLAFLQGTSAYSSGASLVPALLPTLGSGLGYAACLAFLVSLNLRQQ